MAKKSSKSTRRTRAKKVQISKKTVASKTHKQHKPDVPMVENKTEEQVEGSGRLEMVVDEQSEPKSFGSATPLLRKRAIAYGSILSVVVVALIVAAALIRSANSSSLQRADSNINAGTADQILQTGGSVCSNAASQADTSGSTSPDSVDMMLQSVPTNSIQTPQSLAGTDDASLLQGAACY